MSLTKHLSDRNSPVRTWFETHFPRTGQVGSAANQVFSDSQLSMPISSPPGTDHGLVGTAVDFLVRAHLTPTALDSTVASQVGWTTAGFAHKASDLEQAAVEQAKALRPWDRELDQDGWQVLCMSCALLAKFEQCFRARRAVLPSVEPVLDRVVSLGDVSEFVHQAVSEETLADLGTLGRAAATDHLDLRSAVLHLNPSFAASAMLRGADADLIYDHTLLDFKASASDKVVGRAELWQLVGYAMADTDDRFEIEAVGISALRWRQRIIWPLDNLLSDLADRPVPDLPQLRAEFAQLLP